MRRTVLYSILGSLLVGVSLGCNVEDAAIDIKPGSDVNAIDLDSDEMIPVALLGSPTFHVLWVDTRSVAFGPNEAQSADDLTDPEALGQQLEDVNFDGYLDLVLRYRASHTGLKRGDREGCVSGRMFSGAPFAVCDVVSTVPGPRNKKS